MLFENNDHAAQQHAPAGADLVAFKRADFAAHIRILTMPNKALVVISWPSPMSRRGLSYSDKRPINGR